MALATDWADNPVGDLVNSLMKWCRRRAGFLRRVASTAMLDAHMTVVYSVLPEHATALSFSAPLSFIFVFGILFENLCFDAYFSTSGSVELGVPAGPRVQPRVWVGAVSVSATQRAEDHRTAHNGTAVFDLQVDGVVVDLQGSC